LWILLLIHKLEAAMAKLSIAVNKTRCISSGDCVETAPGVFQLGADGKSEVVNPAGAGDAIIISAARSCPVKAITVVDETGVQIFPPPKK
jgi:ferredoxin